MRSFKPGERVTVLRDIYRWDGREEVSTEERTITLRTQILYAAAGTQGTVLETFQVFQCGGPGGVWHAKVLVDGKCLTFRQTSLQRCQEA